MEILISDTLRWQPGVGRWLVPVSAWSDGPERLGRYIWRRAKIR